MILNSAEDRALRIILKFLKEHDGCNVETYSNITRTIPHLTHPERDDMYCYPHNYGSDNTIIMILQSTKEIDSQVHIYPLNSSGTRVINFQYCYDALGDSYWDGDSEPDLYWYAEFSLELYSTEEEYFQASTITELVLTPEENQMFIDFEKNFTQKLITL